MEWRNCATKYETPSREETILSLQRKEYLYWSAVAQKFMRISISNTRHRSFLELCYEVDEKSWTLFKAEHFSNVISHLSRNSTAECLFPTQNETPLEDESQPKKCNKTLFTITEMLEAWIRFENRETQVQDGIFNVTLKTVQIYSMICLTHVWMRECSSNDGRNKC